MLQYIPSFYAALLLAQSDWGRKDEAMSEAERIASGMALCMRDYLFMACMGEARHAHDKAGLSFDEIDGNIDSRSGIFKKSRRYDPVKNLPLIKAVFLADGWGTSFGGAKWAELCDVALEYGTMSDILYVDKVVNKQHNSGTVFNKLEASQWMDIQGLEDGLSSSFLDARRAGTFLNNYYLRRLDIRVGRLLASFGVDLSSSTPLKPYVYKPVAWGDQVLDEPSQHEPGDRCGCGSMAEHSCNDCGKPLCDECANSCEECGAYMCGECEHECIVCGNLVCSMHISYDKCTSCMYKQRCDQCGSWEDDLYSCDCGRKDYCEDCADEHKCKDCDSILCPHCSKTHEHDEDEEEEEVEDDDVEEQTQKAPLITGGTLGKSKRK